MSVGSEDGMMWWAWRDGPGKLIAYDKEYPCMTPGGDPLVLGGPALSGTMREIRAATKDKIEWWPAHGR
jgi:hypothetical protein